MKVLIADDSVLIIERLHEILSHFAQISIVGSFTNGAETLQALRILKPGLAIIDIRMPGLSGLEVTSEYRKNDTSIIFIIITLFSTEYHQRLAMEAGANYFINKINFEELTEVITELLEKWAP